MARYQHTSAEGDPAEVQIRDAATVLIVRDASELEVLMVQRASRAAFGASAWVFPGGRVDPGDGTVDQWRAAAVRETLEESGLLLCADDPVDADVLALWRRQMLEEDADLFALSATNNVEINFEQMHEVGRFITPMGPPRRFDTQFFITDAPDGQIASPDGEEVVHARWISPRIAGDQWRAGEFPLMSVTHRMLSCLARYDTVNDVLAHARTSPEARRVRVNDPDGAYEVLLPEDDGYDQADLEIEHGWVRL